ncbi:MAG: hypothetical protein AAB268_03800 [Elusimicrobiota bacterium]
MKEQPRLFPAFVALSLSLFLASGPPPAAAQMRIQPGAGARAVIPVVPSFGATLPTNAADLSNSPSVAAALPVLSVGLPHAPTLPAVALVQVPTAIRQVAVAGHVAALDSSKDAAPSEGAASEKGRQVFDGAGASLLPSPSPVSPPATDQPRFQGALRAALLDSIGGFVRGWEVPHVEKPSFPYQVERQRRIYQAIADEQTRQNRFRVMSGAASPDTARMILADALKSATGRDIVLDISDPAFRDFYALLKAATANIENYYSEGSLVNVGWGNGEHVTADGSIPNDPPTTAGLLAKEIVQTAFTKPGPLQDLLLGRR